MLCARRSAKVQHARADGVVGQPVDDDEAAGGRGCVRRRRRPPRGRARCCTRRSRSGPACLAARCSSVSTLTLYLGSVTVRRRCACRSSAGRGGRAACGSSAIHTSVHSNWSATSAGAVGRRDHVAARDVDLVFQRDASRFAGHGERAVTVAATMRATRALAPEGCTRMRWPGAACRWPAGRRSRGSRGWAGSPTAPAGAAAGAAVRASSSSQVSRKGISAGPSYQGMAALGAVMFSPFSADSGMLVMCVSRCARQRRGTPRRCGRRWPGRSPPGPSC
jgi:hypothetical protein